jgi:hypothetical protein
MTAHIALMRGAVILGREFWPLLVLEPDHQLWRDAAAWSGDPGAHRPATGGTQLS